MRSYLLALVLGALAASAVLALLDTVSGGAVDSERLMISAYFFVPTTIVVGAPVYFIWRLLLTGGPSLVLYGLLLGITAGAVLVMFTSDAPFWISYTHPDAQLFELSHIAGGLTIGAVLARSTRRQNRTSNVTDTSD